MQTVTSVILEFLTIHMTFDIRGIRSRRWSKMSMSRQGHPEQERIEREDLEYRSNPIQGAGIGITSNRTTAMSWRGRGRSFRPRQDESSM